jgi:hypothetical protein
MLTTAAAALGKAKLLAVGVALATAGVGIGGYAATSGGAGTHRIVPAASTARPTHAATPKPKSTAESEAQGVHGACLSKVAQDKTKVGGKNHNHGGAVSAAAHSCPKGAGDEAKGATKKPETDATEKPETEAPETEAPESESPGATDKGNSNSHRPTTTPTPTTSPAATT